MITRADPLCVFFTTEPGGWAVYVLRVPGGFAAAARCGAELLELAPVETPRGALEAARAAIADRLTVTRYRQGHRPGCGCTLCARELAAAIEGSS